MGVKTVVLEGEPRSGCNCEHLMVGETSLEDVFYDYTDTRIRVTITVEELPTVTVEAEGWE